MQYKYITYIHICVLSFNKNIVMCPFNTSSSGLWEECSGHGRCKSLSDVAASVLVNGNIDYFNYEGWDAEMIHGCDCDDGWKGISCSYRTCPYGPDPVSAITHEIQLIDCACGAAACTGTFSLSLFEKSTPPFQAGVTEEVIAYELEVQCSIVQYSAV